MSIDDAFNFGVETGDFTLGDKTTAAGDGAVSIGGDNSGAIMSGDGAIAGSGNTVNNGFIQTGSGSPVTFGSDNEVKATSQMAKGDIIQDNEGGVFKDIKTDGGAFKVDNHHTVGGNATNIHADGDINGDVDASNTKLNNVGNVDNSVHDSHNVTGSHNMTGSHNTDVGVHGFEGGNVGLPGLPGVPGGLGDGAEILGKAALGPVGFIPDAVEGLGDLLDL